MALTPVPRGRWIGQTGALLDVPLTWLVKLRAAVNAAGNVIGEVSRTVQGASIASTAIPITGPVTAGLYRLSTYARITTAAGASSSLTVTLGFTDGAVSQTVNGAALTANTTTTWQSLTYLIRADEATSITYATTYASSAAGVMKYSLYVRVERVP